jgi:hypothetical protein
MAALRLTTPLVGELKESDMTDRRSLELFGIWLGFLGGTVLWILIGVSGTPLSLSRVVFMFGATRGRCLGRQRGGREFAPGVRCRVIRLSE